MTHAPADPAPAGRVLPALRATLSPSDPVARALTWATMASSLSSGLFYSVSALFFARVVGLAPTTIGVGLTIAGAAGVAGSFVGGHVADRIGADRLLVAATLGQAAALVAYVFAGSTLAFVLTACAAVGLRYVQSVARATLVARTVDGRERVVLLARLRVVTNVFIGLGTALAAVALLVDTAAAYRSTVLAAGVLVAMSAVPLSRLARDRGARSDARPPAAARSPLRDRTYLSVTALNAVMVMLFGLQTVGVPLWIVTATEAPPVTVSGLLLMNTALVVFLQVPAARGVDDVRSAGRAVARAGVMLALACGLYAAAAGRHLWVAVLLLVLAAVAHTAAELWSEAGSWLLAFELADPRAAGTYQGLSQTGYSVGAMVAPLVVTATAIDHGGPGWAALGALFLGAGTLTWLVACRAGRVRPGDGRTEGSGTP